MCCSFTDRSNKYFLNVFYAKDQSEDIGKIVTNKKTSLISWTLHSSVGDNELAS